MRTSKYRGYQGGKIEDDCQKQVNINLNSREDKSSCYINSNGFWTDLSLKFYLGVPIYSSVKRWAL